MSLLDGRSKVCFSQKREMEGGSKNEKMLKKYKQSKLLVYMSYTFPIGVKKETESGLS